MQEIQVYTWKPPVRLSSKAQMNLSGNPQPTNMLNSKRILRHIGCNLKYISPQKKTIMDGTGVGRPAHESHLIYNIAETLYI